MKGSIYTTLGPNRVHNMMTDERYMETIYPTHTCFDDVKEFIIWEFRENSNATLHKYKICHGILHFDTGMPYSHAWIELTHKPQVIDFGFFQCKKIAYIADLTEYYKEKQVSQVTKYTIEEAIEIEKYTSRSPWRKEYMELCSDKTDVDFEALSKFGKTIHLPHQED